MHCIICVTDFRAGGDVLPSPPPHPWAVPKKPILHRVKSCSIKVAQQTDVIRNIAFLQQQSKSWKVLLANLLKITLHHRYFSNNFTTSSEQPYWKIHLHGCFTFLTMMSCLFKRNESLCFFKYMFWQREWADKPLFLKNSTLVKETHFPFILVEQKQRDPNKSCF